MKGGKHNWQYNDKKSTFLLTVHEITFNLIKPAIDCKTNKAGQSKKTTHKNRSFRLYSTKKRKTKRKATNGKKKS